MALVHRHNVRRRDSSEAGKIQIICGLQNIIPNDFELAFTSKPIHTADKTQMQRNSRRRCKLDINDDTTL